MSEHEHDFEMVYYVFKDGWPRALCWECGATLEEDEVNRRINAVDKLSAKTAINLAWDILPEKQRANSAELEIHGTLRAYAAVLEGDYEPTD